MTTVNLAFQSNTAATPAGWNIITGAAATGQKIADLTDSLGASTGLSLWVTTAFTGDTTTATSLATGPAHGIPELILEQCWFSSVPASIEIRGFVGSQTGTIRALGDAGNGARDSDYSVNGGAAVRYDANGGEPFTTPVELAFTADGSGVVEFSGAVVSSFWYLNAAIVDYSAVATPTITNINTTNEVAPGSTATLTGTNLTNATGLNIGSVSQSNFTVVNDTTVTFTGTRGGNPYNQDLTATLLSPDGDATITVQQVPEAGTFAVTADSPNTTDDASLWAGLVDTATSNPVTVVDGDQAWVNTTLDGLAIAPDGTITANETGTFTVQFWRASEGVWGSDQTVSFTLPEEAEDNWPYHKNIRYRAEQTWTWGSRHPKTGMRVRIFNE